MAPFSTDIQQSPTREDATNKGTAYETKLES